MPWFFPARTLQSFEAESRRLGLAEARDLGIMPVEVKRIIGSVGRWRDFDAQFRLVNQATQQRYLTILQKMREGYPFPPVELYKVNDKYYVADGNHRVAAAKELGVAYLDAHVKEFIPAAGAEHAVYWQSRRAFEVATRYHGYTFTNPDSYDRLLSHLRAFQKEESKRLGYEVGLPEATQVWLAEIDAPFRNLVRAEDMLRRFEGRTEDDLVFYFIHHYVGMWRVARGPDQVSYRQVVARLLAMPDRTMVGRFRRFVRELFSNMRDVIDNLTELEL
jgi:hypothetical protein